MNDTIAKKGTTVYCHFSFKRPNRGVDGYGLFAVAFYRDYEGKKVIYHVTKKLPLWENHQFITAIQSYENALRVISETQGAMRHNNINRVMLVTDNSTLAGWIENNKKNKAYTKYMIKAVEQYRSGAPKEILLGIGLCEVRDYEKSYKYCTEQYLSKSEVIETVKTDKGRAISESALHGGGKNILQILAEENNMPTMEGLKEI